MINHTVAEWKHLKFCNDQKFDSSKFINAENAKKLSAVAENLPISSQVSDGVLTLHHNRICARGVVGVVHAESCSLEILPKIDVKEVGSVEGRNAEIRKRLVHMLMIAHKINVDAGALTSMDWQKCTLLEIIIEIFVKKLFETAKKGLPQKYIEFEDDLSVLKGELDIPRQFTIHASNPSVLACRFDQFSHDIPLNQVMKSTVVFLSQISRSVNNQRLLRDLELIFADITYIPVRNIKWDQISIDRTNESWKTLFTLARLLLFQKFQTTTQGEITGYSLLFEMNKLFEEYIGQLVQMAAGRLKNLGEIGEISVKLQSRNKYCLFDSDSNAPKFNVKPDIVVEYANDVRHVIDTKWKPISSKYSDIWKSVKQSDIYQLMTYGELYNSHRVSLFYPHNSKLGEDDGLQIAGYVSTNTDRYLEIVSFDVSKESNESKRIEDFLKGERNFASQCNSVV